VLICLLVLTFFAVISTGPAGLEYLERRRALLDMPKATVMYLPSARCRGPET
jgi:hypothetical protein